MISVLGLFAAEDELRVGAAAADVLGVIVTTITDGEKLGADEAADDTAGAVDAATEDEVL
jgi:hypothetical protein